MDYNIVLGDRTYRFRGLADLLAKSSSPKSGDVLAGIAARTEEERVAALQILADLPLVSFIKQPILEDDGITQLV